LVLGFDPDVIITLSDIKFGEEFGAFDLSMILEISGNG
jgi:hypothetical protein